MNLVSDLMGVAGGEPWTAELLDTGPAAGSTLTRHRSYLSRDAFRITVAPGTEFEQSWDESKTLFRIEEARNADWSGLHALLVHRRLLAHPEWITRTPGRDAMEGWSERERTLRVGLHEAWLALRRGEGRGYQRCERCWEAARARRDPRLRLPVCPHGKLVAPALDAFTERRPELPFELLGLIEPVWTPGGPRYGLTAEAVRVVLDDWLLGNSLARGYLPQHFYRSSAPRRLGAGSGMPAGATLVLSELSPWITACAAAWELQADVASVIDDARSGDGWTFTPSDALPSSTEPAVLLLPESAASGSAPAPAKAAVKKADKPAKRGARKK